ncbi:aminomethyl transferase family protein [Streptomyces phaeochromogenes]|uniref:Aminomethyl transferase family protein n=1 Tax=Streptomyces phaeochromogenes TaxID=1923 RepID=A0ABZ1H7P8_STRPH|nr:aminomethyl transferase family protein [Streptomyces phaeochromogenes]MCX5599865.1 aminomethyl transferase family protein [Streptomyces phaeochromogenes]WRZ27614.1 aminomethyl transferase family protein [Streptomyces phaeochromogenes]WSD13178.1 aminomethyl transferase family protein [Streptomyces phaeochromogenes]WSJ10026.1 aminomethyl transferase family protein [Streptomyces phaeochromogenes]
MTTPSLQDGIDKAGSPIQLLWQPGAEPWTPEVVGREYAGWRVEQRAWHEGVALLNLSHHMYDMWIEGPDATQVLADYGANNFEKFAVGQAKQYVPVNRHGQIVTDGILARESENSYLLSGVPASQHWVQYHAEKGGYDVSFSTDPSSAFRHGGDPRIFRYQIQGPLALKLIEKVFGGPIPETKFFHSTPVTLNGRVFKALRHGMAGQAGYEFIGPWEHAAYVHDAFLKAGEPLGLVQVGALAYTTPSVESGWIPSPVPGIYTDPELAEYRSWLPLFGIEGKRPLCGSFFSNDIADFYVSPFELGYGKMIHFGHDFHGRDALLKAKEEGGLRKKVTLVFDPDDVRRVIGGGEDPGFVLSYARHRVETSSGLVGVTMQTAAIDPVGTVLSQTLIDAAHAEPGTEVTVVWGDHPGAGTDPEADLGFPRIRATVEVSPFDRHARTEYRRDA